MAPLKIIVPAANHGWRHFCQNRFLEKSIFLRHLKEFFNILSSVASINYGAFFDLGLVRIRARIKKLH